MKIEQVNFHFINNMIAQPRPFFRVDIGDKRYYYDFDKDVLIYPSWTSVLSKSLPTSEYLIKWYADNGFEEAKNKASERAEYGTFLHVLISEFLKDKVLEIDYEKILSKMIDFFGNRINGNTAWIEDIQSDLLAFAQFVVDHSFEPVASEITLASRKFGVAGTIDMVGYIKWYNKRILVLIDVKSGRKGFFDQHILQLAGYKETWNENFPKYPVERVYNWSPKEWHTKPSYTFTDQTEKAVAEILPNLVNTFKILHPTKRTLKFFKGKIQPGYDISDNFVTMDIVDYIREQFNLDKPRNEKLQPKLQTIDYEDF